MKDRIAEDVPLRPCVLIVEDDDAVRRSLQLLLRANGLDVRAFASAGDALADPGTREAECLVADLVMPEVDGLELLGALRGDGWAGPAVLISGYLTEPLESHARKAGYTLVLRKPLRDNLLVDSVKELISSQKGQTKVVQS